MLHLDEPKFATMEQLSGHLDNPRRGSPRDGGAAETLSAKRGTVCFAVTAGVFSITYER